jgi:DNA-binding transcriptional MerR regulator
MTQAIWTLDELTERVGEALSVGYHGQPSGRVRHLPDQRAIRWYTTIGLVDRPAATRGRTAMYGPRHLLQLVAIKRLQAQGLSLVAIQAELAGATDAQLARVAQVPQAAGVAEAAPPAAAPPLRRPTAALHATPSLARPLTQGEAPAAPPPALDEGATPADLPGAMAGPGKGAAPAPTLGAGRGQARQARQARFWRERPPVAAEAGAAEAGAADAAGAAAAASAAAEAAGATRAAGAVAGSGRVAGVDGVATLQGVRLGERATLLLDPARPLDDADLRAILDAARPLLRALRARGLDHPGRELP